ncbi:hypothetical protein NM688_g183 [Phlebia brevispora]|uniref:Uncharacterized protein n=1 Tax=Phlebia brevispora TaxID=194682 RepID=A0ACC1TEX5_9APHY|nr:hypothetical protein NM688_g183 [Phlebia brevispora]
MTVYYTITFLLLAAEMATFCVLVAPLPYSIRKKLFHFLSESPLVAKLAYGLKITFIFVGVLFVDALQRMWRVTAEADLARNSGGGMHDARAETNIAARKFYAQRNTYLTGFCLFLSLVLTRTFYIILDLIHTQEEYAKLKQSTAQSSKTTVAAEDQTKQVEELKKKLEVKTRDYDILKKQAEQQAKEYDRIATELNTKTGNVSDKLSAKGQGTRRAGGSSACVIKRVLFALASFHHLLRVHNLLTPLTPHPQAIMSIVTIRNVEFLNNPARFLDPYHFRVTFECIAPIPDDLEWRLIYVSSPGDEALDQELDDCLVGPVPMGVNSFEFEGSAPLASKIPPEDVLGVAALILTGSYKEQEFVRVGYYQNTEYDNEEMKENPPTTIRFDRLVRDINTKPRVTRFQIKWDILPQNGNGQNVSAGAAMSAAVPSADDIDMEDVESKPNGAAS